MKKMLPVLVLLILMPGAVSAGWSVTFENPNPCALKGSSVKLGCSYNYTAGETVMKTAWYKGVFKNGTWIRVDLSNLPSYQNRSEYVGDRQHDCGLAIHDLHENDTGYYYFRFDTQKYGRRSKESVYLTVTDGRPVAKSEFLARAEDAGNYSCAVKEQDSVLSDPVVLDVQYPPLNVSIEVSYHGHLTEGSSVNLTCSSAANPPADNYTWYRAAASSLSSMLQVGSGQVLSLQSVEASHTGLYFCQARNQLGENNSTEVLLTVDRTGINHVIVFAGIRVFFVLLLPLVIIWAWQTRHSAVDEKVSSNDYEDISTA